MRGRDVRESRGSKMELALSPGMQGQYTAGLALRGQCLSGAEPAASRLVIT